MFVFPTEYSSCFSAKETPVQWKVIWVWGRCVKQRNHWLYNSWNSCCTSTGSSSNRDLCVLWLGLILMLLLPLGLHLFPKLLLELLLSEFPQLFGVRVRFRTVTLRCVQGRSERKRWRKEFRVDEELSTPVKTRTKALLFYLEPAFSLPRLGALGVWTSE